MPSASEARMKPEGWKKWAKMTIVELWQAVALSCDLNPRAINVQSGMYRWAARSHEKEFRDRLDLALANIGEGLRVFEPVGDDAHPDKWRWNVRLADFGAWAVGFGWSLPEQFPRRKVPPKWPWGDHNTKLLDALAAAGELWRNYDSNYPATAPTGDDIKKLLIAEGVQTDRLRVAMTQILCADDLKPGPHSNS